MSNLRKMMYISHNHGRCTVQFLSYCQHLRCLATRWISVYKKVKKVKVCIALYMGAITELWSITCHMGSHSSTCHVRQVNVPRHGDDVWWQSGCTESFYNIASIWTCQKGTIYSWTGCHSFDIDNLRYHSSAVGFMFIIILRVTVDAVEDTSHDDDDDSKSMKLMFAHSYNYKQFWAISEMYFVL